LLPFDGNKRWDPLFLLTGTQHKEDAMSARKMICTLSAGAMLAAAVPVFADNVEGGPHSPRARREAQEEAQAARVQGSRPVFVGQNRVVINDQRAVSRRQREYRGGQPAYAGQPAYRSQPVYQAHPGYRGQPVYVEPAYYSYGAAPVYAERRDNTAIGAIGGAILGAIIGNHVGRGDGGSTALGAGAGAVLGGILGGGM
jgi:hypothetical protein